RPTGPDNVVGGEPRFPNWLRKLPSASKSCTLAESKSLTAMRPSGDTVIPVGKENWPKPVPGLPKWLRRLPLLSNTNTTPRVPSVTNVFPVGVTVIPKGPDRTPAPNSLLGLNRLSRTTTRKFVPSTTIILSLLTVIPIGTPPFGKVNTPRELPY